MKPPPSPCLVVQTILIIIAVFLYKFLPLLERCGNLIGNIVVYQFFHLYQVFFSTITAHIKHDEVCCPQPEKRELSLEPRHHNSGLCVVDEPCCLQATLVQ